MDDKYGLPPKKFEFEHDMYHNPSFARRVQREADYRKYKPVAVEDKYKDDNTVALQCPSLLCNGMYFNAPIELVSSKSTLFTGEIECPACHTKLKVLKGKLYDAEMFDMLNEI